MSENFEGELFGIPEVIKQIEKKEKEIAEISEKIQEVRELESTREALADAIFGRNANPSLAQKILRKYYNQLRVWRDKEPDNEYLKEYVKGELKKIPEYIKAVEIFTEFETLRAQYLKARNEAGKSAAEEAISRYEKTKKRLEEFKEEYTKEIEEKK